VIDALAYPFCVGADLLGGLGDALALAGVSVLPSRARRAARECHADTARHS
jgi:hypothetical protein